VSADPILFGNLTSAGLHAALAPLGVDARLARRLQAAVLRRGALPASFPEVSAAVLRRVRAATRVPRLELLEAKVSPTDGFAKFLFRGEGRDPFEAVRIPLLHRPDDPKYVVCVSAQVGCGMGCAFCATGRMGFTRNLAAWEMVAQVTQIAAAAPHPVRGVVFMGMGEPLLNYDAVVTAGRVLCEPCGPAIPAKAITISTIGIVPGIRRLAAERLPFRLIVSLVSADPATRRRLLPATAAHLLRELIAVLREWHKVSRQRVTLAWPMLAGVNTAETDAVQLAALVGDLPVKIDLIDVNDPTGRFHAPTDDARHAFRDALRRHLAAPVARRYSGGADIAAGCGMLSAAGLSRGCAPA
jgi:23S rRNA (adenine2503-C2)-methyltransferase